MDQFNLNQIQVQELSLQEQKDVNGGSFLLFAAGALLFALGVSIGKAIHRALN